MLSLPLVLASLTFAGGLSDSQVLQRGPNGTATPVIRGTVSSPATLRVKVNDRPWSDAGRIAGDWEVRLPELPTGGPYRIELQGRDAGGAALGEVTCGDIYVGDLWVLAGQSNMVGRARIADTYPRDPRVRMLSVEGKWQLAEHPLHEPNRPGAGPGIEFGRAMVEATQVPVGLIPCARGGTSMAQWSPDLLADGPASLYGNLVDRVRRAGGRVAGVLWYQGENDTGTEPAAVYQETFRQFIGRLRADLGAPALPFYYAQLARYVNHVTRPAKYYSDWNIVQEAQRQLELEVPGVRMVATIDLEQGDLIHLSRESLERVGRRFARAVQGSAGPRLAEARWASHQELRLRFTGVSRSLQAPGGRVFGFEAVTDGKSNPLFFQAAIDPAGHEIVLRANRDSSRRDTPAEIDLWYGRGLNPICNVTDGADLALPMFGPVRLPPRPPGPR